MQQSESSTLIPAALAAQAQAEPGRFFPPLAMASVSALPAALVARHVAALEDRVAQRAALRYAIATGNYVARAAARSIIDWAVESGASGPAVVALIDAETAAVQAKAKAFDTERSSADARRKVYKERTQALRVAVSRRGSRAEQEISVLTTHIRTTATVKGPNAFDELRAAGLSIEQLAALGRIDPLAQHQQQCKEYGARVEALRPVAAACNAFADDPGNYEHLEGLDEFAVLVEAARAAEGAPL